MHAPTLVRGRGRLDGARLEAMSPAPGPRLAVDRHPRAAARARITRRRVRHTTRALRLRRRWSTQGPPRHHPSTSVLRRSPAFGSGVITWAAETRPPARGWRHL